MAILLPGTPVARQQPAVEVDPVARRALVAAAADAEGWPLDDPLTLASLRVAALTPSSLQDLADRAQAAFERRGLVLLTGAPVDDPVAVLALFCLVSIPSPLGNGSGVIHHIVPRESGGNDRSESADEFSAHSDSTFLRHPHETLGLACVTTSSDGGLSFVVSAASVRAELAEEELAALSEPVFPFWLSDPLYGAGIQLAPIFGEFDESSVRFRSDVVHDLLTRSPGLTTRHQAALAKLEQVLAILAARAPFRLQPGDMIILDNRHLLHGRTGMASRSRRELLRIKGHLPTGARYSVV